VLEQTLGRLSWDSTSSMTAPCPAIPPNGAAAAYGMRAGSRGHLEGRLRVSETVDAANDGCTHLFSSLI
jgi:hypothetical protein